MLTFEDCLGLCGLSEEEVRAIAEHERIPQLAALELGHYLCRTLEGEQCIKRMICNDILRARAGGSRERELALKLLIYNFILQHPRCEERHRRELRMPERRCAGV